MSYIRVCVDTKGTNVKSISVCASHLSNSWEFRFSWTLGNHVFHQNYSYSLEDFGECVAWAPSNTCHLCRNWQETRRIWKRNDNKEVEVIEPEEMPLFPNENCNFPASIKLGDISFRIGGWKGLRKLWRCPFPIQTTYFL